LHWDICLSGIRNLQNPPKIIYSHKRTHGTLNFHPDFAFQVPLLLMFMIIKFNYRIYDYWLFVMLLLLLISIVAIKCIELHSIYWNYLREFCVPLYCNTCAFYQHLICAYFWITKDDWHHGLENLLNLEYLWHILITVEQEALWYR
jgi:hypothetical protein